MRLKAVSSDQVGEAVAKNGIPSRAMLAPDRALVGISSLSLIKDAKVSMSVPLTSTPLIAVMARAPG